MGPGKTRQWLVWCVVLAVVLLTAGKLQAQDVASITGVVTDPTGAVLTNVDVTLVNTKTNASYTAKTDGQGSYRIVNVSPGPAYKGTFASSGFETTTFSDLYMTVGTTRTQNVVLRIGSAQNEIQVSSGNHNVTINTTDASVGNNLDLKAVADLPVQIRSTASTLFNLQPGITNGSVTGARTDQTSTTVDGLDANDIAAGQGGAGWQIIPTQPVDAIQEFKGTVAGLGSNIGTGSGGQFQLVTKSGSNAFHGDANEYHRDTTTAANTWFNNNAGVPRAPLIRNQFGGQIGGPVVKDKLFFFFNYYGQRITQSQSLLRTVPLDSYRNNTISYIKDTDGSGNTCAATSRQDTTPQCIGTLSAAQVAALDPQHVGFNANLQQFINQRYPRANDLTSGDGVNTGGYRFNTPTPDNTDNYIGRIDYNLTNTQKIFGRFTIQRRNSIQTANEFPGDPVTAPFQDRSYAYVVGHTWVLGTNKVNQFEYGDAITKFNFPTVYYPLGITSYGFGSLSAAYLDPGSQQRRIPIPIVRDDFNWIVGSHSFSFGGTFKFIKTNSNLTSNFNNVGIGLGGNTSQLNATLRPADIRTAGTTSSNDYDTAFTLALGRLSSVSSNYDYDNKGTAFPQGSGAVRQYRFYQTELYFGDIWKVSPSLTIDYGVRYQLYSVPFEANGRESVQNTTFDQYFNTRVQQSAAGMAGNAAVPFITYTLGGKANNGANLYSPNYKDFGPRFAFAYNPPFDRHTTFNGSAGINFDRTVINAINFIQDQSSYLFQNSVNTNFGSSDANAALASDPRIGANLAAPAPLPPPTITVPYTPFVTDSVPNGLINNQFNTIIDPKLKDPYSIAYNFGFQHEFPSNFVLRMNYAGRLGRRLLAQVDASQLIDFPDQASGQQLSSAFSNLILQSRAGAASVAPEPWFENQVGPGATEGLYENYGTFINRGDFADFVQALAANGYIQPNIGLASQFAGNTYVTNKGFSTYNGLLLTLSHNYAHGLQFDFNYTWSHSIDNTSFNANSIAANGGSSIGFICDALRPRECRGNSDFDISNALIANFVYDLPFGRGRSIGGTMPLWLEEIAGGWQVSGIPGWTSGQAYTTLSGAYVAGYANNAPGIFNGDREAVAAHVHKTDSGQLQIFRDPAKAQAAFTGPVGFQIGSRNNLRGPTAFTMDAGLGKTFPLVPEKLVLKFRADAFNVLNHPVFGLSTSNPISPTNDITSGTFGQVLATSVTPRVAQFSLRLEF